MRILPSIDGKTPLVGLVSDTVLHFRAEHHLSAVHVVEHDVLKDRLQMLFGVFIILLDQVEVDELVSGDLDPDVSLNIVDEPSSLNLIILFPLSGLRLLVELKFEEEDVTGASGDQRLIINQVHLPKIHLSHSVEDVILSVLALHDEGVALSVE